MGEVSITAAGVTAGQIIMGLKRITGVAADVNAEGGNPDKVVHADDILAALQALNGSSPLVEALSYAVVSLQTRELRNFETITTLRASVEAAIAQAEAVSGLTGITTLTQAMLAMAIYDIPFTAGWGDDGAGDDLEVRSYYGLTLGRNARFFGESLRCEVAPVGADIEVDIEINGTSIYATKPLIAAGATTGTAGVLLTSPTLADKNDLVEFFVTQVGVATKGQKLSFSLIGGAR